MHHTINASTIATLHSKCIIDWKSLSHIPTELLQQEEFYQIVEENHAFNYQLWHAEDKARRDDRGFQFVYQAKREIDFFNQQRNNRMEAMDEWLFTVLQPAMPHHCPVHSESPGMMIDRLSILSLKSYYMALQTQRLDVGEQHRTTCTSKLAILHQQLQQLMCCFDQLIEEIVAKNRTFRVYHQFKMYNDPTLNPELHLMQVKDLHSKDGLLVEVD